MAPRGIPLTTEERRALFDWVLADGAAEVASDLGCSPDSVANWLAGLCSPFQNQHTVLARKIRARQRKPRETAAR